MGDQIDSAPESASAPVFENQDSGNLSDDQINSLLHFDPMGESAKSLNSLGEVDSPVSSSDDSGDVVPAEPQPDPGTPSVTAQDQLSMADLDRRLTQLDQYLQNLPTQLQGMMQQPAATPQTQNQQVQGQEGQANQGDELPGYQFSLPEALVTGLQSEDPREVQQALGALLSGLARNIHQTLRQEYRSWVPQNAPNARTEVSKYVSEYLAQRSVYDDFYSTYSGLRQPALQGVVVQVANRLVEQNPNQEWNEKFRDKIAEETAKVLGKSVEDFKTKPSKPQGTGSKPPAMNGGVGTRQAGTTQTGMNPAQEFLFDLRR